MKLILLEALFACSFAAIHDVDIASSSRETKKHIFGRTVMWGVSMEPSWFWKRITVNTSDGPRMSMWTTTRPSKVSFVRALEKISSDAISPSTPLRTKLVKRLAIDLFQGLDDLENRILHGLLGRLLKR